MNLLPSKRQPRTASPSERGAASARYEYDNLACLPRTRSRQGRHRTGSSRMAWELPASPTCQPNGPASTRCSALLRSSGMFETSLWRRVAFRKDNPRVLPAPPEFRGVLARLVLMVCVGMATGQARRCDHPLGNCGGSRSRKNSSIRTPEFECLNSRP